jgi:hypothetical protein
MLNAKVIEKKPPVNSGQTHPDQVRACLPAIAAAATAGPWPSTPVKAGQGASNQCCRSKCPPIGQSANQTPSHRVAVSRSDFLERHRKGWRAGICKDFNMNNLQTKKRSLRSKSVKVGQTDAAGQAVRQHRSSVNRIEKIF